MQSGHQYGVACGPRYLGPGAMHADPRILGQALTSANIVLLFFSVGPLSVVRHHECTGGPHCPYTASAASLEVANRLAQEGSPFFSFLSGLLVSRAAVAVPELDCTLSSSSDVLYSVIICTIGRLISIIRAGKGFDEDITCESSCCNSIKVD